MVQCRGKWRREKGAGMWMRKTRCKGYRRKKDTWSIRAAIVRIVEIEKYLGGCLSNGPYAVACQGHEAGQQRVDHMGGGDVGAHLDERVCSCLWSMCITK